MGAPEKPCGRCIFYRRKKWASEWAKDGPSNFGACVKIKRAISANMTGCSEWGDCRDNPDIQWSDSE
jgi:hypothetical protein